MAAIAGLRPLLGAVSACRTTSTSSSSDSPACLAKGILSSSRHSTLCIPDGNKAYLCRQSGRCLKKAGNLLIQCTGDVSVTEASTEASAEASIPSPDGNWAPVIPLEALPKGERRLVRQDGETVLLLWYKNDVYAIENTSPAEGAYSEGLINARLTPEGCIVCPSTDSTYDLKTGKVVDWMPSNPVLRLLTPSLRDLVTYPIKIDSEYIYIDVKGSSGESAEIVFGGATQAGKTATDVAVDEVRMIVDENEEGFGFTPKNEIINGRAAMIGFLMIVVQELVTGKGFLKGIGFLDFLYRFVFPGYSP